MAKLGPKFQEAWDRDFRDIPDKPLMLTGMLAGYLCDPMATVKNPHPPGAYVTVGNWTAYPYSRGHVHVTGPGVGDELDFETGFFGDEGDLDIKKLVWA